MALKTPTTVVFDLDGTLIDTAPDLVDTLNVIFRREGLPPVDYDEARNLIGGGARAMIERGLKLEGRMIDKSALDLLVKDFIAYYSDHIADRSQPFPGLIDTLDQLAAQGFILAVCTNKLESLSRQLLGALKLTDRFAAICGQDTFGVMKPDPVVLTKTIESAKGDPRKAIMVGDSITDIRTARAAMIPVVAVTFGYTEIPVKELGPDRVIDKFADLPAVIDDLQRSG